MKYVLASFLVLCTILSLTAAVPANAVVAPMPSYLLMAQKPGASDNPPDWSTWNFQMYGILDYLTPWATFDYSFDGHGLNPQADYTLLYYPDPWPGNGLICIDHGTPDANHDLILHASGLNTGSLPKAFDLNANIATTTIPGYTGAKIWLVLSSDVDCQGQLMTAWNPSQYLFEVWLIQYDTSPQISTSTKTSSTTTTTSTSFTEPTTTSTSFTIAQPTTTTETSWTSTSFTIEQPTTTSTSFTVIIPTTTETSWFSTSFTVIQPTTTVTELSTRPLSTVTTTRPVTTTFATTTINTYTIATYQRPFCAIRWFWNFNTHSLDHVTVCAYAPGT